MTPPNTDDINRSDAGAVIDPSPGGLEAIVTDAHPPHRAPACPSCADLAEALRDMLTATQPQHTFRHVFIGEAQEQARAALAQYEATKT